MVICSFLKFGMVKVLKTSHNVVNVKNVWLQIKTDEVLNIFLFLNLDFDDFRSVILSPKKVHGLPIIRMYCNWPLLNVQLMVNEAWLFTFWQCVCVLAVVSMLYRTTLRNATNVGRKLLKKSTTVLVHLESA